MEVGWLDHTVKCMFSFLRNFPTIFQSGGNVYISANSVWKLQLLHCLTNTWYDHSFHFRRSESVPWNPVVSIFITFIISDVENLSIDFLR